MEGQDERTQPRRFVVEVTRGPTANLKIRLDEEGQRALEFDSWEAFYRYLSERFPEWHGYLR
ncbi:hypothetical protein [Oceanithermus sp.]|uniref:hypothetical protein n=1 Tax=Oceanithermus sp. TaxID=2268145 RepID=UPI0025D7F17E|nr:hypothetical protein [Oceanithermus sp.]